jgi:hypothetical protein
LLPITPMGNLGEIVCAHQPYETTIGKTLQDRAQALRRIAGAKPLFQIGDLDPSIPGDTPGGSQPLAERGHAVRALQRVLRTDEPPNLIEVQAMDRRHRDVEVAAVGGIERSSQYADAPRHLI